MSVLRAGSSARCEARSQPRVTTSKAGLSSLPRSSGLCGNWSLSLAKKSVSLAVDEA